MAVANMHCPQRFSLVGPNTIPVPQADGDLRLTQELGKFAGTPSFVPARGAICSRAGPGEILTRGRIAAEYRMPHVRLCKQPVTNTLLRPIIPRCKTGSSENVGHLMAKPATR
jgi:hypothetical protein